jgi:uncharacterized protein with HEPN domain
MTEKDDSVFVGHILESIENIEKFMKGVPKVFFSKNREKQSAVIREIEIIGEASKNLSQKFKEENNEVDWKPISGFRDKLIHHYFGINLERVWNVLEKDLPDLKKKILRIKKSLEKKES